jgi:hypothetical protein
MFLAAVFLFFFRQRHFGVHHQKVYRLSCEMVP